MCPISPVTSNGNVIGNVITDIRLGGLERVYEFDQAGLSLSTGDH